MAFLFDLVYPFFQRQSSVRNTESVYLLDGAQHHTSFASGDGNYTARVEGGQLIVEADVVRESDQGISKYVEKYELVDDNSFQWTLKADTGKTTVEIKRYFDRK
jgi:hypothetical protein